LPGGATLLISVHIPKTGGTSFGQMLEKRFGERLLHDYADRPLSHGAPARIARAVAQWPLLPRRLRGHEAVHGHFLALKYAATRGDVVTWLREPAQRIVSRYHHYLRDVAAGRSLQQVDGLRPGLTLDEFIAIPRFQDTCAKYFAGFPLARVRCFGFSGDMREGLARMRRELGLELGELPHALANPERASDGYAIPPELQRRIERLNPGDYRIWRYACERDGR
jgi:hypothetical protein